MKRDYIDNKEFCKVYTAWHEAGKPKQGALYTELWDYVINACKASISALQKRYNCTYQDYDGKVLDSAMTIVESFFKKDEIIKSITAYAYFPCLGVCCGRKAKLEDWNNAMSSYEELVENNAL